VNPRLQRLLADPKAAKAAALVARRLLDGALDEAGVEEALDYIEGRLAALEPVEEVPPPEHFELVRRLEELKAQGVPEEMLAELEASPLLEAVGRAKALAESVAQVRRGPEPVDLRWRGEWLAGVDYQPGDVVAFQASSFVCVKATREQPRLFHPAWKALAVSGTGPGGPEGPPGPPGPAGEGVSDHGLLSNVSADQHHAQSHSHASHTGVGADDHHAQAHTHPAEGAVVVTHASTTGQTANDHHNQAHSIVGADHTAFPGGTTQFLRADATFAVPPGGGGGGSADEPIVSSWMGC
jgi:hypothetical protein